MPTITILNNNGDDEDGDGDTMKVRQSWAKNENLETYMHIFSEDVGKATWLRGRRHFYYS